MRGQRSDLKDYRNYAASTAIKSGLPSAHDPVEGTRLIRAFLRITDPQVRLAIIHMVEQAESDPAKTQG